MELRAGLPQCVLLAGGLAVLAGLFSLMLLVASFMPAPTLPTSQAPPSREAVADIPPGYLTLYQGAAARYGIDWAVLAGIGKVECDHGRDPDPACSQVGEENSAGAGGPMQFEATTWARYGITPQGTPAPPDGRWNPADAVYSAANYLAASGAPGDYAKAIYAYNHSQAYVTQVEEWAIRYRQAATASTPERLAGGPLAQIDPSGYARPPGGAPVAVARIIAAANKILPFAYVFGGGHADGPSMSLTDPRPVEGGYDCSSAVSYALHGAGLLDNVEASGALEDYGAPGPGHWVTVYASPAHAFLAVAGIVLDTSHLTSAPLVSPSSGPSWQQQSAIALEEKAGDGPYVARHPPGL